jgi:hypothetical protein
MATWQTQVVPWHNGGTALQAAATITTDTASTAVVIGNGRFDVVIDVDALTLGTGGDLIVFDIEANSLAATSTWYSIGNLVLGDATSRGQAMTATGEYKISVDNQSDYQIRVYAYLTGSASSLTYSAYAYPIRDRVAP